MRLASDHPNWFYSSYPWSVCSLNVTVRFYLMAFKTSVFALSLVSAPSKLLQRFLSLLGSTEHISELTYMKPKSWFSPLKPTIFIYPSGCPTKRNFIFLISYIFLLDVRISFENMTSNFLFLAFVCKTVSSLHFTQSKRFSLYSDLSVPSSVASLWLHLHSIVSMALPLPDMPYVPTFAA